MGGGGEEEGGREERGSGSWEGKRGMRRQRGRKGAEKRRADKEGEGKDGHSVSAVDQAWGLHLQREDTPRPSLGLTEQRAHLLGRWRKGYQKIK